MVACDVTNVVQSLLCGKGDHHTHSTCSVVGVVATKHVQLPISSESTGLVVLQRFNCVALTIAQLELLRRPGRAGIPFYRLITRS